MSRVFIISFLSSLIGLMACDRAIDDRYGGLVVIPVQEVDLSSNPRLVSAALPPPRPENILAPIPTVVLDEGDQDQFQGIGFDQGAGLDAEAAALQELTLADPPSLEGDDISNTPQSVVTNPEIDNGPVIGNGDALQNQASSTGSGSAVISDGSSNPLNTQQTEDVTAVSSARETGAAAQEAAARLAGSAIVPEPPLASSSRAPELRRIPQESIFLPLSYDDGLPLVSSSDLQELYQRKSYDLAQVIAGEAVPGLILQRLPERLGALNQTNRPLLKELFIKAVLPLCLVSNERTTRERAYILDSEDRGEELARALDPVILGLGAKYNVSTRSALLERVDAVPISLCLAQAIYASSWGLDEAVINQNALFGPWVRTDQGFVSSQAAQGGANSQNRIILFSSLQMATDAYTLHLNRDDSLSRFRAARAQEKGNNRNFPGLKAAEFVAAYNPQATNYTGSLIRLIRENQLDQYDLTRLEGTRTAIPVF